jgi:hypothetical protein
MKKISLASIVILLAALGYLAGSRMESAESRF